MRSVFVNIFLMPFDLFSGRPAGRNFDAKSNAAQKSPRRNFGASANAGGVINCCLGLDSCGMFLFKFV